MKMVEIQQFLPIRSAIRILSDVVVRGYRVLMNIQEPLKKLYLNFFRSTHIPQMDRKKIERGLNPHSVLFDGLYGFSFNAALSEIYVPEKDMKATSGGIDR